MKILSPSHNSLSRNRHFITKLFLFIIFSFFFFTKSHCSNNKALPDTVKVGSYVISLHDINFRDKEYTARFWLWLQYKNQEFDFVNEVEVPNAKSLEKPDIITDVVNGKIFVIMKMKTTMKQSWEVSDYPFDDQEININIENTIHDSKKLVFIADTVDSNYDPNLNVDGWKINNFKVTNGVTIYPTAFGDSSNKTHKSEYAQFTISMSLERSAWGLFLKIFTGMYIAFLISMVSFILKPEEIEPRFGLPVGGLFAAVGNKYIIDSFLPETSSFTLVDSLHSITFLFIFFTIASHAWTLMVFNRGNKQKANRYNKTLSKWIIISYLILNIALISLAIIH
jgi:hypothetical protein